MLKILQMHARALYTDSEPLSPHNLGSPTGSGGGGGGGSLNRGGGGGGGGLGRTLSNQR